MITITITIIIIIILWLVTGFIAGLHLIIKASKSYGTLVVLDILAGCLVFVSGPICPLIWFIRSRIKLRTTVPKKETVKLNRILKT